MKGNEDAGPLCQNCFATDALCRCTRELDSRPCCTVCEHRDLPADIRVATPNT